MVLISGINTNGDVKEERGTPSLMCLAGCGQVLAYVGACKRCYDADRLSEHRASMKAALASVPARYRDAVWGSAALADRVPDLRGMTKTPAELLASRILILYGETEAGKTSLACALLRWIVDQTAPAPLAAFDAPEAERAAARAAEVQNDRASAVRFVDAREVPVVRNADGAQAVTVARGASILFLDDVNQEAGTGDAFSAKERCREVSDLLSWVDKHERPIVITTPAGKDGSAASTTERWTALYGGNIMRRFWRASDAQIIELRRRK